MGLAASQARFLGLTARKSNTEYEGQQVNQQRTALANESASLYSQLTNLTVPTPPEITNYYKTEYSFVSNGKTYSFESLPSVSSTDGSNSKYTFGISYKEESAGFSKINDFSGIYLSMDNEGLGGKLEDYPSLKKEASKDDSGKINESAYTGQETVHSYIYNSSVYYRISKLNEQGEDEYENAIYKSVTQEDTRYAVLDDVQFSYDSAGAFSTMSVGKKYASLIGGNSNEDMNNISVTTTTVADDKAYNLAMEQYQKDYNEYEKTMAAINAKTEVLQSQDKTLELRLNQLDTEQNAISTEMDAVQKVIEKNVESTFKTFA